MVLHICISRLKAGKRYRPIVFMIDIPARHTVRKCSLVSILCLAF